MNLDALNQLRRRAQSRLMSRGLTRSEAPYGTHPRQRQLVWSPAAARPNRRVLLIHGGGFQRRGPEDFESLGPSFAKGGWTAAALSYRLGSVPDAVEDTLAAIDAAPPDQPLATWGYSAGALLAVLGALLRPGRVQACVAVACPGDLTDFPFLDPLCPPADRARLSPALLPPADSPPILLIQGDADEVMPLPQAQRIDARHPSVTLRRVPGGDHALRRPVLGCARARRQMRRWLEAQLPG